MVLFLSYLTVNMEEASIKAIKSITRDEKNDEYSVAPLFNYIADSFVSGRERINSILSKNLGEFPSLLQKLVSNPIRNHSIASQALGRIADHL